METTRRVPIHFLLPVVVFSSVVLLGVIVTALQPRLYEAQARIWVQPKNQASQKQEVFSPLSTFFTSPLVTSSEIIKSGVVLQEASQILRNKLGVQVGPEEIAANLTAKPVTNADVLKVTYCATSGKQACLVLQAVLDAFEQVNSDQSTGSATQSRKSIEKHLDMLRKSCVAAQNALKQFQDRNQAVSLPEQVSSLLRQAAASEAEIERYKLKIAENRSKIDYLQSQLGLGPEDALMAYKLTRDEGLIILRKKIVIDKARLISLRSAYRDEHPYVKELKATIAAAQAEANERVRSLGVTIEPNMDIDKLVSEDPVRQNLLEEMVKARSDEVSAQSGLTQTTSLLADTNARLSNIPAAQVQQAELARKSAVATEALSEAEKSLHNAQLNESVSSYVGNTKVIDWPVAPQQPTYPNVKLNIGVGLLVGFLLAAIAFVLGPVVRRAVEVQRALNLPIVDWMEHLPSTGSLPASLLPLNRLRLNMQHAVSDQRKCIVVTSPDKQDGKTLVASSLAVSFANSGARVLLIDANLLHPRLHSIFGVPIGPGLTDFVPSDDKGSITRIAHSTSPSLAVITKGSHSIPSGDLAAKQVLSIIQAYKSLADIIIVDTPAITESPDCLALMEDSTVLLVVARLNHTRRTSLSLMQSQLRRRQVGSAGLVIVGANDRAVAEALRAEEGDRPEAVPV